MSDADWAQYKIGKKKQELKTTKVHESESSVEEEQGIHLKSSTPQYANSSADQINTLGNYWLKFII